MAAALPADRPVTGTRVLAWVLAFFFVIFAANGALIYFALTSFPGLEVASSYKAGQQFEAERDAARAQETRHWTVDLDARIAARGAAVTAAFHAPGGRAERDLTVEAILKHPTAASRDRSVTLTEGADGTYAGLVADVAPGQWILEVEASRDGERLFRSRNHLFLKP
ncbi:FixH family protein [Chthonobacter rhizosphaerae]|uniref:FixH family protein n=1 Tax=Chthonobacter rhizosphaerae TaxID=2735553 RepID=UPI0015EE9E2D|nr:FixH family protein [Chthonobacter rhizosphaerae]